MIVIFSSQPICSSSQQCSQILQQVSDKYNHQTKNFANASSTSTDGFGVDSMYVNRLAEETVYVFLEDQREVDIAKRHHWITQYPNDNHTTWEYDRYNRDKHKVEKSFHVSLRYFRYMANVPINVFQ